MAIIDVSAVSLDIMLNRTVKIKKFLSFIFVLGIILLSLLVYFFFSTNGDKIEAGDIAVGPAGEMVVVITDRGYKPENLIIKTGSQVKWVNGGTKMHSLTFKLNYSLENISVIDQNLGPKESLTFKFEKAGKFSYFDKNDHFTGVVEVQ